MNPEMSLMQLDGACITRWTGREMALDGGNGVVTDDTFITGFTDKSPPLWTHDDVAFWQFVAIDVETSGGAVYRLLSEFDHGDGREYGLFLEGPEVPMAPEPEEPGNIFRTRVLEALPTGAVTVSVHRDPAGAIVEASLAIGGDVVRFLSGEIHPRFDGRFDLVSPDETILLQLNGKRPPSDDTLPDGGYAFTAEVTPTDASPPPDPERTRRS